MKKLTVAKEDGVLNRITKRKLIDLKGQVFGRLTVLSEAPRKRFPCGITQRQWNCVCSCGKTLLFYMHL